MPPTTRDRIVAAAMRLFAEKGYASTSIADILGRSGVNAGSLYYFFPAKQDVLLAVLDAYHGGIDRMLLQPAWRGVGDPLERVFALLRAYREMLRATDCTYGCPIGSIALELHEPDPAVRERLAANFRAWVAAVQRCLDDAGDRLPRDTDRHALAVFVLTTMEGGVMLARTERSLAPYDAAVAALRAHLSALERSAKPPTPVRKEKPHEATAPDRALDPARPPADRVGTARQEHVVSRAGRKPGPAAPGRRRRSPR